MRILLIPLVLLGLTACSVEEDKDPDVDDGVGAEGEGEGEGEGEPDDGADDDADGFTNGEENAAGTNPAYAYSHPYEGGYNVGWCDSPWEATGPTGTGQFETTTWTAYQVGDVPNNFTMNDQYDEPVDLYSFCGKHVVVVLSAGWCGPCRSAAAEAQALQDEYRDDGVQIVEMMTGDNADNPPDLAFVQSWADEYGFVDIPVLQAPEATTWESESIIWDTDFGIPSVWHIDPEGYIVSADDLVHDPGQFL
jgi:thiol-disulfide isomerase/thioredoxin